jgi:hypothetical protein
MADTTEHEFTITWEVNTYADTPYLAAQKVADLYFQDRIARGEPDTACVFEVTTSDGTVIEVDLGSDLRLSREQLQEKYEAHDSGWGSHPNYTRQDWKYAVANDDSLSGYWEWVYYCVQEAAH